MDSTLVLYNSLNGKKETFKSILPNHVGMYVCGPTVYSNVHLGNCRTFISFDLIHMNPMSEFHIANNFPSMAILLSAMIFWILSHVFLHGVRLEEENELTI